MTGNSQDGHASSKTLEAQQKHVHLADADNRIDGIFRDPRTDEIFQAYVSGEIAATDIAPKLKTLLETK